MTNSLPPIASIDQVWPKIKGYFIAHSVGRSRKHHPKQVLEAIFWLAKAGLLPDRFPPYKTVLFSDTPDGAKAPATFYSLVSTAKANGLNTFTYLCQTMERIGLGQLPEDLLPIS